MASNFMGGFARGFQQSYERNRERQKDLEDDIFRMQYGRFYKSLDERKAKEAQEAKWGSLAEDMAGGDAGKQQLFYNMLANGSDPKELLQIQRDYEIQTVAPDAVEGPQSPSQSVPQGAKGGSTGQPMDIAQQASLSRSDMSQSGRSPFAKEEDRKMSAMQEKNVRKIAKMSGMSELEVRKTMYGKATQDNSKHLDVRLVPKTQRHMQVLSKVTIGNGLDMAMAEDSNGNYKLAESIRKRRSDLLKMQEEDVKERDNMEPIWVTIPDEEGNLDTRKALGNKYGYALVDDEGKPTTSFLRFSEASPNVVSFEREDKGTRADQLPDSITKAMWTEVSDLHKIRGNINTMATNAAAAVKIFEENPQAQSSGASLAAWVRSQERNTESFIELYKTWAGKAGENYTPGQLKSWIADNHSKSLFGLDRVDLDKGRSRLLLTNLTLTFEILGALGQKGNAVNVKEFDAVFGALSEGDPTKYKENIRHYLDMAMTRYSNQRDAFKGTTQDFSAQDLLANWEDYNRDAHEVVIEGFDPEVRNTFGFFDSVNVADEAVPPTQVAPEETTGDSPFAEGTIVKNKKTGQRARIVNGKPVPID